MYMYKIGKHEKKEKFVCMHKFARSRAEFGKNIYLQATGFFVILIIRSVFRLSETHTHTNRHTHAHASTGHCAPCILSSGLRGVILSQNRSINVQHNYVKLTFDFIILASECCCSCREIIQLKQVSLQFSPHRPFHFGNFLF